MFEQSDVLRAKTLGLNMYLFVSYVMEEQVILFPVFHALAYIN